MFTKLQAKTEFNASSDRDALFGYLKNASQFSDQNLSKVLEKCRSFENFARVMADLQTSTQYLVVRQGTFRFIGVIRNPKGLSRYSGFYDLVKAAPAVKNDLTVFECFWSDSIFWKKFVSNVINKNKLGDEYWMQQVALEQSQTRVSTNRDGWVNGETWVTQDNGGRERQSFIGGAQRGAASGPEDVRTRAFINF